MGREKIKYLFNRNHIEIFKIENPTVSMWRKPVYEHVQANTYSYSHTFSMYGDKDEYKLVKKESPLGFYYMSKVRIPKIGEAYNGGISRTILTYPVPGETNTYYQIKYVTRYDDNHIGKEDGLRPWDIYPGDKDFPDHMIEGLIKEVNTFFELAESAKITSFYNNPTSRYYVNHSVSQDQLVNINTVKREVFEELFGNPKGPRFQTNEEKILAHGFDLKTSFRKDKEKK